MDGGSRPMLSGLHDILCHSRSSGSFRLRVAVVELAGKTLKDVGFGGSKLEVQNCKESRSRISE